MLLAGATNGIGLQRWRVLIGAAIAVAGVIFGATK